MRQVNVNAYCSTIENRFNEFVGHPCEETGHAVTRSIYDFIIAVAENLVEAYQVLDEIHESALRRQTSDAGIEVLEAIYASLYRKLPNHYNTVIFEPQGIFA